MKIVSLSRAGAIAALASTAVAAAPAVIAPVASARAMRPERHTAPLAGPQANSTRSGAPRPSVGIAVGRPVFGPITPPRR
jgi:hypothetical protein